MTNIDVTELLSSAATRPVSTWYGTRAGWSGRHGKLRPGAHAWRQTETNCAPTAFLSETEHIMWAVNDSMNVGPIAGSVVDAINGEPIRDGKVILVNESTGQASDSTMTGQVGEYELAACGSDSQRLVFRHHRSRGSSQRTAPAFRG